MTNVHVATGAPGSPVAAEGRPWRALPPMRGTCGSAYTPGGGCRTRGRTMLDPDTAPLDQLDRQLAALQRHTARPATSSPSAASDRTASTTTPTLVGRRPPPWRRRRHELNESGPVAPSMTSNCARPAPQARPTNRTRTTMAKYDALFRAPLHRQGRPRRDDVRRDRGTRRAASRSHDAAGWWSNDLTGTVRPKLERGSTPDAKSTTSTRANKQVRFGAPDGDAALGRPRVAAGGLPVCWARQWTLRHARLDLPPVAGSPRPVPRRAPLQDDASRSRSSQPASKSSTSVAANDDTTLSAVSLSSCSRSSSRRRSACGGRRARSRRAEQIERQVGAAGSAGVLTCADDVVEVARSAGPETSSPSNTTSTPSRDRGSSSGTRSAMSWPRVRKTRRPAITVISSGTHRPCTQQSIRQGNPTVAHWSPASDPGSQAPPSSMPPERT